MSGLPFELLLGLRYLRPKRTFVSIITLISILGVMLGVAVLIIVISVMTGFDRQLKDKILGFYGHLKVFTPGRPLADYQGVLERTCKHPHVRGAAPFIVTPVFVQTQVEEGRYQYMTPWLRGIDPKLEAKVSNLPFSIKHGKFDVSGNGVVVGVKLAEDLNLEVGDPIAILSPISLQKMRDNQKSKDQELILPSDFVVRGIFDVGYYEYNAGFVVCSLANAQDLLEFGERVTGLVVMLDDPGSAALVREQLRPSLGASMAIKTWYEENSAILDALMVEKNVMFYILFFIVIVAAFGITSALITFVVQKTREIGMLKALGATREQIIWLFFSQTIVVGTLGVLSGLGLGMLALHYRNEFLHFMNRLTGFELFPSSIYAFTELPALIVPGDIAIICGGSLVICALAGLIPAWNADASNLWKRFGMNNDGPVPALGAGATAPGSTPSTAIPVLRARALTKSYQIGKRSVDVLQGISLSVARGDFIALRGSSGAGKSTLLHLLGGLDAPDTGEIWFDDQNLAQMSARALTRFRNRKVGFIFQSYHLFPELDALENVCLPARIARTDAAVAEARGRDLLGRVGLSARLDHLPAELSGGEQQRVAIARALINQPDLILADEPTGNLDSHTGAEIIDLLQAIWQEQHTTLIIATHDAKVAARAPRVLELADGQIRLNGANPDSTAHP